MKTLNAPGDLNISRVLRLIWQLKGISRIEIAQQLGVDKSTVTKIVTALEEIGIIHGFAQGAAGPQGGRKPIHLEVTPEFGIAVGIEITTDGFYSTIVNLNGEILESIDHKMPVTSIFETFDLALTALSPFIDAINRPVLGIGVGVPAIVNTEKGQIIQSIPLVIPNPVDFTSWAQNKYGTPVYIENDARCGCLGEITLRHSMELENALFLLAEIRKITGSTESKKNLSVGCGFIINGQTHYGTDFSAGEFRSILWEQGNLGQFQSNDVSADLIGSDEGVTETMFSELARHVAFLTNILNLNYVFVGGLPEDLTAELSEEIVIEIERKWPYDQKQHCKVIPASLGTQAVAYGAAGHCLQRFFSLPNIYQPSGNGPSIKEVLTSFRDI